MRCVAGSILCSSAELFLQLSQFALAILQRSRKSLLLPKYGLLFGASAAVRDEMNAVQTQMTDVEGACFRQPFQFVERILRPSVGVVYPRIQLQRPILSRIALRDEQ